jgi:methanethiol oxidase
MTWRPDPSFYPSPRMAMKAPAEKFAYVAAFDPTRQKPDAIAVVDVDPDFKTYARPECLPCYNPRRSNRPSQGSR